VEFELTIAKKYIKARKAYGKTDPPCMPCTPFSYAAHSIMLFKNYDGGRLMKRAVFIRPLMPPLPRSSKGHLFCILGNIVERINRGLVDEHLKMKVRLIGKF